MIDILSIPIVEYTINSHVYASCMYVFIFRKKYIVYPFRDFLYFPPLIFTLFI